MTDYDPLCLFVYLDVFSFAWFYNSRCFFPFWCTCDYVNGNVLLFYFFLVYLSNPCLLPFFWHCLLYLPFYGLTPSHVLLHESVFLTIKYSVPPFLIGLPILHLVSGRLEEMVFHLVSLGCETSCPSLRVGSPLYYKYLCIFLYFSCHSADLLLPFAHPSSLLTLSNLKPSSMMRMEISPIVVRSCEQSSSSPKALESMMCTLCQV